MNKYISILVLVLFILEANGQGMSRNLFKKSNWSAPNTASSFFQSDTVKIIRLKGGITETLNFKEDLADFYKTNFIILRFRSNWNLDFFTVFIDSWVIERNNDKYSWKFKHDKQILNLSFKRKTLASFRVVSKASRYIKSNISEEPPILTEELILIRLK